MFFIGPCLSYRGVRRDLFFTTDFTVGYYNYNSLLSRGYGLDQIKGKTFGYGLGLGLDVRLYKGLCIGAGINLLGGSLVKVTVNSKELELSDDNRINLTRLTTNLGLKLWL